jgi:tetratricopeptide (TPR) repeat protein
MRRALAAVAGAALLAAPPVTGADPAHPPAHVPQSLSGWAQGARLFDGLGDFHRSVSTDSAAAQQYFDQGMRWLWAFNHDEATRSFAKAAELDPQCAACYWGVALTVGPNYNVPTMAAPRARLAYEALGRAQANAAHATAVERALIGALAARYARATPPAAAEQEGIARAYASAMREVAQQFPEDADVQTLCAEAEMNVHAWKLWTAQGAPVEGTPEIVARLEAVLARSPQHPGANHYYLHVMEASPQPGRALAAAARLRGMMPAAGHLEHMPAHILQRVGRYEEAADANRRGAAADVVYFGATDAPDYYAMYLAHNYWFLAYSAAMAGRKAETLDAVQKAGEVLPLAVLIDMGDSGWNLSEQYAALLRFGLWDEMLALLPPDARAGGARAAYLYGRGVALAARGGLEEAQEVLAKLRALAAEVPQDATAGFNRTRDVLAVAQPLVAARIAASSARTAEAVTLLEQAVAAEDRLAYDEPSDWFFPARHLLGAQLLLSGQAAAAEAVYREDLRRNPDNGWALHGLAAALQAQGKAAAAARTARTLRRVWQHADVHPPASAFWQAGPDTAECACQREGSAQR